MKADSLCSLVALAVPGRPYKLTQPAGSACNFRPRWAETGSALVRIEELRNLSRGKRVGAHPSCRIGCNARALI